MMRFRYAFAAFAAAALAPALSPARAEPAPDPSASPAPALSPAPEVRIEGKLLEKGTRKPLEGVNVYLIPRDPSTDADSPHALKAVSGTDGSFFVEHVPAGNFRWVVNLTGYDRLDQQDEQMEGAAEFPRALFLEKTDYQVYETTVYSRAEHRDEKTKSLDAATIATLPGANGDPVKAVQNLPGVARAAAFSSQVIIEGSSPRDTRYLIDGQEVPIIFHFGGLSTVLLPESVDRVDYLSAGYGPENGRALGGLVSVWTRDPRADRLHGFGYVDFLNAGAELEGPLSDRSSFLLGARQSYIGFILGAAGKNNKDFNFTAAPDFGDVTGIYRYQLTPIDTFRLVTVGSLDTLSFVLSQPVKADPSLRGTFDDETAFFRLIPELIHRPDDRTTARLSMGLGRDWVRFDTGNGDYFHLQSWSLGARGEVEHQMTGFWRSYLGFDNNYSWNDVNLVLPYFYSAGGVPNPFGVSQTRTVQVSQTIDEIGLYWRNAFHAPGSPLTVSPSLRVDYYNTTHETLPVPRGQIKYAVDDSLSLWTAGGLYVEPPSPEQIDPVYGNPAVKSPEAWHSALGFDKDFRGGAAQGWHLTSDLFYKWMYNLVIPTSALVPQADGTLAPENYANDGHGRAFGLELQGSYSLGGFDGWISYTLSRSTRWSPSAPEAVYTYDQTHILTALLGHELPGNWHVSGRLRYVSGDPYTPITGGVLDADNDLYLPTRGPYYSERLSPFFEIDLRVDKRWIYDKWILSAYLDIENVTNRANPEAIRYSYDYTQTAVVSGIPILPTFGLKGEF